MFVQCSRTLWWKSLRGCRVRTAYLTNARSKSWLPFLWEATSKFNSSHITSTERRTSDGWGEVNCRTPRWTDNMQLVIFPCERLSLVQKLNESDNALNIRTEMGEADVAVVCWRRWRRYEFYRLQILADYNYSFLKRNRVPLIECNCIRNNGAEDWQEFNTTEHFWISSVQQLSVFHSVHV